MSTVQPGPTSKKAIQETPPEGLSDNFNGWGKLWLICLESDISQQKALANSERFTDPEAEPLESETEVDGFRNPNPPNTGHIFDGLKPREICTAGGSYLLIESRRSN
jgi:hypothetical protein